MFKHRLLAFSLGAAFMAGSVVATATDRWEMEGEQLFEFHACMNCHGAQGKDPVSRLVPKIGGMDSAEIHEKAMKIMRGETDSEEAKLMKSAVAYSQACDAPPSSGEIQKIAEWLSTL